MEFSRYITIAEDVGAENKAFKKKSLSDQYLFLAANVKKNAHPIAKCRIEADGVWVMEKRPYYNIWPKIVPLFFQLDLANVLLTDLTFSQCAISIHFAKGHGLGDCHSFLLTDYVAIEKKHGVLHRSELRILSQKNGVPNLFFVIPRTKNTTFQEALDKQLKHESIQDIKDNKVQIIKDIFQVTAALLLLDNDPDIIEASILNKDIDRLIPLDRKVERAAKRGKIGWEIGKKLHTEKKNPHYVNAHLCTFWVGPKRAKCIIKMRRGHIVHKSKVVNVPTGREG